MTTMVTMVIFIRATSDYSPIPSRRVVTGNKIIVLYQAGIVIALYDPVWQHAIYVYYYYGST
jgi:hypothetical protein